MFYGTGVSYNSSNFNSNHKVLNDSAKDWSLYLGSTDTVFKPYPSFDAGGNMFAARNDADELNTDSGSGDAEKQRNPMLERDARIVSPAFAVASMVTYFGRERVHFINWCTDIDNYIMSDTKMTPYDVLYVSLGRMVNRMNKQGIVVKNDPRPCPTIAFEQYKNIRRPALRILMRGALMRHKGVLPRYQKANQINFNVVLCMDSTSGVKSFVKSHFTRIDAQPLSSGHFTYAGMFDLNGIALEYMKQGSATNALYEVKIAGNNFTDEYADAAMHHFGIRNDIDYINRLRSMFGPRTLDSMLNLLTCQQMVDLMLEQLPASLVYICLEGSPYEALIPQNVQMEARESMAWKQRTGLAAPEMRYIVNNMQQGNNVNTPQYGMPQQMPGSPMSDKYGQSAQMLQQSQYGMPQQQAPAAPQNDWGNLARQVMQQAQVSYTPAYGNVSYQNEVDDQADGIPYGNAPTQPQPGYVAPPAQPATQPAAQGGVAPNPKVAAILSNYGVTKQ